MLRLLIAAAMLFAVPPAFAQTLEQLAGQMIVVGFAGNDADDASVIAIRDEIAAGLLGGVMYLKPNIASLRRVTEMNQAFRDASPDLPPFLTVDQEGGEVERLDAGIGFKEAPSARAIAAAASPEGAEAVYADMAGRVADLGFTVNWGPVVDLDINPRNPIIGGFGRSYGKDSAVVIAYAKAFIEAHHAAGLLTALKHFPGHGSSTTDSHEGYVDITHTWKEAELDPYRELLAGGYADFVMVGHLIHRAYTQTTEQLPASLSYEWITGVLRGQLGFTGVVVSDDLEMAAIRKHFSLRETVVKAVNAGVDVLLFGNTADYRAGLADEIRAILVAEAEADPQFRDRIEESYGRIVALKQRIGD